MHGRSFRQTQRLKAEIFPSRDNTTIFLDHPNLADLSYSLKKQRYILEA